ncbi:Serine/Threonine kinase domain protein (macronuclear) [Tetrahymena thermophila SB210]|uniref:non-specific serine/threonine protein kinase n=1 Tax=Tetrahymena thermophila (strain SB210) TaxID=312017 RepID=Q22UA8_TETTS|nr:Serine/Threonine kinase domain protein [Tetrahymena thermophila SB210]EAR88779.2 Serine/Threonine kinase domain protein [Tetrahymena thermophila SB210]|eukprot:XP_001009024.2 Serine/Threonine kinase domain protein [Tetrahymena thermophila SB210]
MSSQNQQSNHFNIPDGYRWIKKIGEGAYGQVHLVQSIRDGSKWAIKNIYVSGGEDVKKKRQSEYKILKKLDNPHIIKFKEAINYRNQQLIQIIMEYTDGGDLEKLIEKQKQSAKPFEEEKILDFFIQICLGLDCIHKNKIIHRDIKPANIFLTAFGQLKIGDFGVSKELQYTKQCLKTIVGTPYYIAPEIVSGYAYNSSVDIWSLGVILYQLCCLQPPFQDWNEANLYCKIKKKPYPPIAQLYYSGKLKTLISKLLRKCPKERYTLKQIFDESLIQSRLKVYLKKSILNRSPDIPQVNNFMEQDSLLNQFIQNDHLQENRQEINQQPVNSNVNQQNINPTSANNQNFESNNNQLNELRPQSCANRQAQEEQKNESADRRKNLQKLDKQEQSNLEEKNAQNNNNNNNIENNTIPASPQVKNFNTLKNENNTHLSGKSTSQSSQISDLETPVAEKKVQHCRSSVIIKIKNITDQRNEQNQKSQDNPFILPNQQQNKKDNLQQFKSKSVIVFNERDFFCNKQILPPLTQIQKIEIEKENVNQNHLNEDLQKQIQVNRKYENIFSTHQKQISGLDKQNIQYEKKIKSNLNQVDKFPITPTKPDQKDLNTKQNGNSQEQKNISKAKRNNFNEQEFNTHSCQLLTGKKKNFVDKEQSQEKNSKVLFEQKTQNICLEKQSSKNNMIRELNQFQVPYSEDEYIKYLTCLIQSEPNYVKETYNEEDLLQENDLKLIDDEDFYYDDYFEEEEEEVEEEEKINKQQERDVEKIYNIPRQSQEQFNQLKEDFFKKMTQEQFKLLYNIVNKEMQNQDFLDDTLKNQIKILQKKILSVELDELKYKIQQLIYLLSQD